MRTTPHPSASQHRSAACLVAPCSADTDAPRTSAEQYPRHAPSLLLHAVQELASHPRQGALSPPSPSLDPPNRDPLLPPPPFPQRDSWFTELPLAPSPSDTSEPLVSVPVSGSGPSFFLAHGAAAGTLVAVPWAHPGKYAGRACVVQTGVARVGALAADAWGEVAAVGGDGGKVSCSLAAPVLPLDARSRAGKCGLTRQAPARRSTSSRCRTSTRPSPASMPLPSSRASTPQPANPSTPSRFTRSPRPSSSAPLAGPSPSLTPRPSPRRRFSSRCPCRGGARRGVRTGGASVSEGGTGGSGCGMCARVAQRSSCVSSPCSQPFFPSRRQLARA